MWTQSINLRKITDFKNQRQTDQLVIEKQTKVYLNNKFIVELVHTPQLEKELALGYLILSQQIGFSYESIKFENDTVHVNAKPERKDSFTHSAFAKPDKHIIFELTAYFQQAAVLFKKTAITESAAFAKSNNVLATTEDLTQEAALYKAVGQLVMKGLIQDVNDYSLLISAKLDLSLMKKITYLGVGLVISRTAPTKQALEYAHSHNVSIVGFARGKRFNWYVS